MKKFVCDLMLGKLCRWLRIMGYDTITEGKDRKLKRLSTKRTVLTRDRDLETRNTVILESLDLDGQLEELVEELDMEPKPDRKRCPLCNGLLEEADKEGAEGKVPEKVLRKQDRFWECEECGKYYWEGTHWKGIRKRLKNISDN